MELKHDLTNLLPRLSKARLQQFLDQLFQPQVTNVNPLAQRMTNPAKTDKTNFQIHQIAWTCLKVHSMNMFDNAAWVFTAHAMIQSDESFNLKHCLHFAASNLIGAEWLLKLLVIRLPQRRILTYSACDK